MAGYTFSALMEWKQIRAEFERAVRAAKERGITQEQIAAAGGLSKQNYVSKLLHSSDDSLGPHIVNLIGAIEGIGMRVSEFFAAVERRAAGESPPLPPMRVTAEDQLERDIGRLQLEIHRLASSLKSKRRKRTRQKRGGVR